MMSQKRKKSYGSHYEKMEKANQKKIRHSIQSQNESVTKEKTKEEKRKKKKRACEQRRKRGVQMQRENCKKDQKKMGNEKERKKKQSKCEWKSKIVPFLVQHRVEECKTKNEEEEKEVRAIEGTLKMRAKEMKKEA